MHTPPVASFQLFEVERRHVLAAAARMALDRGPLRRSPGLQFAKLVGAGKGLTFTPRDADLRTWGLFTVWDGDTSLERFQRQSPVIAAWNRLGRTRLRLDMTPLRSRGSWSGRDPFAGSPVNGDHDGPVAAITRATIRWRRAVQFWRTVPPVSIDLHHRPGLLLGLGFGEAPIGLQGTLTVWESAAALHAFAYAGQPHRHAIERTVQLRWYREELFARLAVLGAHGPMAAHIPTLGDHA